jgi:DNA-binding CsgD family transcriptional regulator
MMNDEKKAKTTKPTSDSSFSIHHSSFLPSGSSFIIPNSSFACEKCHKIRRISRCDPNAWNEIVTYLSAGLLYGREVQRPAWFPKGQRADRVLSARGRRAGAGDVDGTEPRGRAASLPGGRPDAPSIQNPGSTERVEVQSEIQNSDEVLLPDRTTGRKIAYTPRPTRAPSARRPQIERMLLAGMSFKSIAAELGLAKGTILWHAQQVYKHHHVRTLVELFTKHNRRDLIPPRNPTEEIRRRILAGESNKQIAAALNVGVTCINNRRQQLRKKGVKLPDARAHNGGRRRKASATFAVSNAEG